MATNYTNNEIETLIRWLSREGFDINEQEAIDWLETNNDDPCDAFNEFMACNANCDHRQEARKYY